MFIKLWNSGKGKILKGTIISILIFTLTFANALCLVPYLLESHAVDTQIQDQGEATDNENVSFKAVFKEIDEEGNESEKYSITKNTDETVMLYVTVKSSNGYLKDVNVDFQNSNFVCEGTGEQSVALRQIYENEATTFSIPLKVKKSNEFQLNQLNMISDITFTATYVSGETEETITSTKQVNVIWIQNEEIATEVSQSLITNKVYEINEKQKRVLQVELESKLINSNYPVKTNKIKIDAPQIAGADLEDVKVIAQNKLATNGKELAQENWSYNQETKTIDINIENLVSEDGKISWVDGTDKFIITYVYSNNGKAINIVLKAANTITLQNNIELEPAEQILNLENEVSETGNTITLTTTSNNEVYKGYMYAGEETEYETLNTATITYLNSEDSIKITNSKGIIEGVESEENFTKTIFSKEQLKSILGENGTITIYNSEDMETPLKNIELSEEELEENITVEYEKGISNLTIITSKPVKEGKIEVLNYRKIKLDSSLTEEQIKELSQLKINSNLVANKITEEKAQTISLVEPTTNIEISADKNNISAVEENSLRLATVLKTDSAACKLFKNPTLEIEFPQEIENATIENISLVFDEELQISKSEIVNNESGNKVIKVYLEGEQTKYSTVELQGGANIVIDLKIAVNKLTPNKNVDLKATCINNGENALQTKQIKVVNKTGFLNEASITIGENTNTVSNNNEIITDINVGETANYSNNLINNYLGTIESFSLIGTMPQDDKQNTTANLTSAVSINIENATIKYTEDLQNWVDEVVDYSLVKSFKIETETPIAQGQILNLQTALEGNGEVSLEITGTVKGQNIQKAFAVILKQNAQMKFAALATNNVATLTIAPQVGTEEYHVGQIVTYKITATNNGQESLENLTLEYQIPEGAVYTELVDAQDSMIDYQDDDNLAEREWKIAKLLPEESIEKEISIKLKETGEASCSAILKDEENTIAETTKSIRIEKSKLEIYLAARDNLKTIETNNDSIKYVLIINNTSEEKIENATISIKAPKYTNYYKDQENITEWSFNSEDETYSYTIDSIQAGEKKVIKYFEVKIDSQNTISKANISNYYTIAIDDETYQSNIYNVEMQAQIYEIHQTIEHNEQVTTEDKLKYIIKVKSTGELENAIEVRDILPEAIQAYTIVCYKNNEEISNEYALSNDVTVCEPLGSNDVLTIEIEALIYNIDKEVESICVKNTAEIVLGNRTIKSEEINTTILNAEYIDLEKIPDDGPDAPTDNPENTRQETTYSISGLAWLDENENGIREEKEEVLKGIRVYLLDKNGNSILKDNVPVYDTTSITGTYKFNSLTSGEYMVAFEYNSDKYSITKYQVKDANSLNNSNVIGKEVSVGEQIKTVAITDIITINSSSAERIDIGLINASKFDLSLEKFISKLVVSNNGGTTTYEYTNTDFAKAEINAKYLEGTSLILEYEIKITNEGIIEGYVSDVIDYVPKELTFNSELNPDWYMSTDGNLHNISLTEEPIALGKTKTVKLILTKTLGKDETGTIANIAEIGASSNVKEIEELDSIAGNRKDREDDIGVATLLVSISTGGPTLYIGIVTICMIFLRRKYIFD